MVTLSCAMVRALTNLRHSIEGRCFQFALGADPLRMNSLIDNRLTRYRDMRQMCVNARSMS